MFYKIQVDVLTKQELDFFNSNFVEKHNFKNGDILYYYLFENNLMIYNVKGMILAYWDKNKFLQSVYTFRILRFDKDMLFKLIDFFLSQNAISKEYAEEMRKFNLKNIEILVK